jgi:hypothetical protein
MKTGNTGKNWEDGKLEIMVFCVTPRPSYFNDFVPKKTLTVKRQASRDITPAKLQLNYACRVSLEQSRLAYVKTDSSHLVYEGG